MNQVITQKLMGVERKSEIGRKPYQIMVGGAAREGLGYFVATDPLTGLINETQALQIGDKLLAQLNKTHQPLSIALFIVSDLPHINKSYGELVGDRILLTIAELLIRSIRIGDHCARVRESAFLVILPQTNIHGAQQTAHRIQTYANGQTVRTDRDPIHFTINFYIETNQATDETFQELLTRAMDNSGIR